MNLRLVSEFALLHGKRKTFGPANKYFGGLVSCHADSGCPRTGSISERESSPHFVRESWQNEVAERWVGSCRDLLDHIIAVDQHHLKRRPSEYIRYYHEDGTHFGLGKGTPDGRTRTIASGHVVSHVRLEGLHHRYDRAAQSEPT